MKKFLRWALLPAGLIGVALAGCTSDEADEPQPELPAPAPELIEGDEPQLCTDGKSWVVRRHERVVDYAPENLSDVTVTETDTYFKDVVEGDTICHGYKCRKVVRYEATAGADGAYTAGRRVSAWACFEKGGAVYSLICSGSWPVRDVAGGTPTLLPLMDFGLAAGTWAEGWLCNYHFDGETPAIEKVGLYDVVSVTGVTVNGVERRATVLDGGSAVGADGTVIDRNVIYVEGVGASRNNWLHRWEEYAQPGHQVYAYEEMVACYDSDRLIFTASDFRSIFSF